MTEQSKMPARIWADMNIGIWLGKAQPERRPEPPVEFIRADLVEQLAEALRKILSGAPATEPDPPADDFGYFSDDYGDLFDRGCESRHWELAEIARTALSTYAAAVGSKETTP